MAIEWSKSMRTGVESIDRQHRNLIAMLNDLVSRVGGHCEHDALPAMLEALAKYADGHFNHEEECMEHYRCPAAMVNKAAHGEFLKLLAEFSRRLHSEGPSTALAINLEEYLSGWIVEHMAGIDSQLSRCVKAGA